MRIRKPSPIIESFWTKLTFAVGFIVIFVAKYTQRSNSTIPHGPSIFLPPNQLFSTNSTPDIIHHLNMHCIHEQKVVFGGFFAAEDYRRCEIRNDDSKQECRSNEGKFKGAQLEGEFGLESTTENVTCSLPQLINASDSQASSNNRFPSKPETPIRDASFTLVGKMRISPSQNEPQHPLEKILERALDRTDNFLKKIYRNT